jgi:hypothetical protein
MYNKQSISQSLPEFVILSAERGSNNPMQNSVFTDELESILKSNGYAYKKVEGRYKNQKEESFVVILNRSDSLTQLIRLASKFDQESILLVNSDRKAELIYTADPLDGYVLGGTFRLVDGDLIQRTDLSYTYDPNSGYYYSVY